MIGTSDQSCWLAEACKILLLLLTTEVYRQTKLGDSLVAALEDLLDAGKIDADLALKVLSEVSIVPKARQRIGCFR